MKTMILTYTDGIYISGAFTSILDIYFNLKNLVDVDLNIVFDLDSLSIMRYFRYQNFFGDGRAMKGLTKNTDFESDVIIISYELLANIAKNKVRVNIGCDRLIILDSLDTVNRLTNIWRSIKRMLRGQGGQQEPEAPV